MFDDRRHAPGDFDRLRSPFLNAAIGIAPYNTETRVGHFGPDQGPDFATKILDAIDIRFPIHGADEGDQGRG